MSAHSTGKQPGPWDPLEVSGEFRDISGSGAVATTRLTRKETSEDPDDILSEDPDDILWCTASRVILAAWHGSAGSPAG